MKILKFLIVTSIFFNLDILSQDIYKYKFVSTTGDSVIFNDFRDKVIYINVWQTYCSPCISEIPMLKQLKTSNPNVIFLSITPAKRNKCLRIEKKHPLGFISICEADSFTRKLGAYRYPSHFVVDKKGNVKKIETSTLWPYKNDNLDADEKWNLFMKWCYNRLDSVLKNEK